MCLESGGVGLRKVKLWQKHLGKRDRKLGQGLGGGLQSPGEFGGQNNQAALTWEVG